MIYWIEDEDNIRDMLYEMIKLNYPDLTKQMIFFAHWDELPKIKDTDIIVYDLIGVGNKPEGLEHITSYVCSGSCIRDDLDNVDIPKPFDLEHIHGVLKNHI